MNDSIRHSRQIRSRRALSVIAATGVLGWSSACAWLDDVPIQDLGDTSGGLGAPTPEPSPEKEFPEQIDPGFAGHWVGYVENPFERDEYGQAVPAVFGSGSTEVTLDYRFEGEVFTPAATLVFGAAPGPVPEPGVAYPPGVHHTYATASRSRLGTIFRAPVVEGFAYEMQEYLNRFAGYDPGSTSMLAFPELAAFVDWCSVQVPLDQGDGDFDCLGAGGLGGGDPLLGEPCIAFRADGTEEEVDCDFAAMCLSDLCRCDADSCQFSGSEQPVQVFLERQGDQIIGTISGATLESGYPGWYTPMGTLRLFRAD